MEDERQEELDSLQAIFPELIIDPVDSFTASLELANNPAVPLLVRFIPALRSSDRTTYAKATEATEATAAHVENDVKLSHLPPLTLRMTLPSDYPASSPPKIQLLAQLDWLPAGNLKELEQDVVHFWEDYGRGPILYVYIDHLQQAAERGFDLEQSAEGCLVLSSTLEPAIVAFDAKTKQATFDAGTYDCGVCLERRKGSDCYQMHQCEHIFCRECLQAFYNNAIKEGDIAGVRCLDPACGTDLPPEEQSRKRKKNRTLHTRELLAMGVEESVIRRFLELKRKKKLEADKNTVYCPRTWCQGPAKSAKYPPIPTDLSSVIAAEQWPDDDSEDDAESAGDPKSNARHKDPPLDPNDRLAICEKCSLAFCRVCYMGWHSPFAPCRPRNSDELSPEEKASYDYIRLHTSPCAYCKAPVQKTMGCNHMCCFQCKTHFCYLCGAWLPPSSPYKHFNTAGTPCFERLWELEEGEDGGAPADGPDPARVRDWEQLAIEVARQADAAEAEEAAAVAAVRAQTEGEADDGDGNEQAPLPAAPDPPPARHPPPLEVAVEQQLRLDDPDPRPRAPHLRAGRRPRNPFPARPPAQGVAHAVRNHEHRGGPQQRRRPIAAAVEERGNEWDDRRQAELQRFLELAQRDEEDGWDSDELGDDDEGFVIR